MFILSKYNSDEKLKIYRNAMKLNNIRLIEYDVVLIFIRPKSANDTVDKWQY